MIESYYDQCNARSEKENRLVVTDVLVKRAKKITRGKYTDCIGVYFSRVMNGRRGRFTYLFSKVSGNWKITHIVTGLGQIVELPEKQKFEKTKRFGL